MNIEKNLEEANKELARLAFNAELVIVGGAAFIMKKLISRFTYDVDYINKVEDKVAKILSKHKIDDKAKTFETNFGDWESDLEMIKEYSNLKVYSTSSERLLAARMFNRKRYEDLIKAFENDKTDIDQIKFEEILEELIGYNEPTYINEFKENISLIDELYKIRGWNENKDIKRICEGFVK